MKRESKASRAVVVAWMTLNTAEPALAAGVTELVTRPLAPEGHLLVPGYVDLSADGRYVAFQWEGSHLVAGDTNNVNDVFVYDRWSKTTDRVSLNSLGVQGNGRSEYPAISADGRFVAFESSASNLVDGDTNSQRDIFVHDRATGATTRVSIDSAGEQGRLGSFSPTISREGRYVAFDSYAPNLVADDTNAARDVFVHDRETGSTTRVSIGSEGSQGDGDSDIPAISGDGRFVAFASDATNLVTGDSNDSGDVFVHDRQTGMTTRVSVSSQGAQGDDHSFWLDISHDGGTVAFTSLASNLVAGDTNRRRDVFLRDRAAATTERISVDAGGAQGDGGSITPSISDDGSQVAYLSWASNLVPGDSNGRGDVFVFDRLTGATSRVSVASSGIQGNDNSVQAEISGDGRIVAFQSYASNLVDGDENGQVDVFAHDRWAGPCVRSATTACLQDGRFEAAVTYRTAETGGAGELMEFDGERAENLDSAFFTFFGPTNFEMGLKVLDACLPELGDKYWVFVSGLTDQGWTVRVRDTWTSRMQAYVNPIGDLSTTFRDATTFDCAAESAGVAAGEDEESLRGSTVEWEAETDDLPERPWSQRTLSELCSRDAATACLQNGRFRVRVGWRTTSASGTGEVMSFAGQRTENVDSVFYTFFGATNFEMGLKVLDACRPELGDKYWVFLSGLTDQGWSVTVEDLAMGRARSYANAVGSLSTTVRDSTTFDCD